MNNGTFDEAMENLRKRMNVILVNNAKDNIQYTNTQSFVSRKIFNKNFVVIHEIKPVVTLDKPIYVGLIILYLSKLFNIRISLQIH